MSLCEFTEVLLLKQGVFFILDRKCFCVHNFLARSSTAVVPRWVVSGEFKLGSLQATV